MEEEKLTDDTEINVGMMDKEVIKALEWALKTSSWTASVAGKEQNMFRVILDLINRQKAEIERLTEEKETLYFEGQYFKTYIENHEEIWKRNAMIETAEFQKKVDELTEERHKYFIKATLYYAICKGYGIDNFYDEELEVANKGVEVE